MNNSSEIVSIKKLLTNEEWIIIFAFIIFVTTCVITLIFVFIHNRRKKDKLHSTSTSTIIETPVTQIKKLDLKNVASLVSAPGKLSNNEFYKSTKDETCYDRLHNNKKPIRSYTFDTHSELKLDHLIMQINEHKNDLSPLRKEITNIEDTSDTKCAKLWFSLVYDFSRENLKVTIFKIQNFTDILNLNDDTENLTNCFVKVFILPEEKLSNQTKITTRCLNPKFFELFNFPITKDGIYSKSIRFVAYNINEKKQRFTFGHVLVNLKNHDLTSSKIQIKDFESLKQEGEFLGNLCLSLFYNSKRRIIKIGLIRLNNISLSSKENYHAYFRVTLTNDKLTDTETRKSKPQLCLSDQEFNCEFIFKLNMKANMKTTLVISLILIYENNIEREYGRVLFNYPSLSSNDEDEHLGKILTNPDKTVTQNHSLNLPYVQSPK